MYDFLPMSVAFVAVPFVVVIVVTVFTLGEQHIQVLIPISVPAISHR